MPEENFKEYHKKQVMGALIAGFAAQGVISVIGYWGGPQYMLAWALRAVIVIYAAVEVMNYMSGKTKPLPFIGEYSEKL